MSRAIGSLNSRYHKAALYTFLAIMIAHWAEHGVQAVQVFALGWPRPEARGVLGLFFPWLVTSEWLHYWYAIITLVGLLALRPAFMGTSRVWWNVAIGVQIWHHFEHALLVGQALAGRTLFGSSVPTSIIQLLVPRVELHLIYNGLVFVPMLIAMYLHVRPTADTPVICGCASHRLPVRPTLQPSGIR